MPTLTLADLGVLRDARVEDDGTVVVEITPTYTGCPAMGVMRADLVHALHRAGFGDVEVRTVLAPAWSTDWISDEGRRKLARPAASRRPGRPVRAAGPVPLNLGPTRRTASCGLRLGRHRGALGVRRHRLQGAAPLPQLPRALRARQGDLSP